MKQPLLLIIGDYKKLIEDLKQDPEEEAREYATHMSRSLEEYEVLQYESPNSEKIIILGGAHMDFTDAPFRDALIGKKTLDAAMRVHTIVSQKMLQFMDHLTSKN